MTNFTTESVLPSDDYDDVSTQQEEILNDDTDDGDYPTTESFIDTIVDTVTTTISSVFGFGDERFKNVVE